MYDLVLCNIPKTKNEAPPLVPCLLKSIVEKNGFTCKVLDWNYDLFKKTGNEDLFKVGDITFNLDKYFEPFWSGIEHFVDEWIEELGKLNPRWFGASMITTKNILPALKIFRLIKEKLPHIKIVIGGETVKLMMHPVSESLKTVGEYFLEEGLIDAAVVGDGQKAILDVLNGKKDKIILAENVHPNNNPIPDYSDLDMSNYIILYVIGSTGCVNRCRYCDSATTFRQRKGELIANEMIEVKNRYGIGYISLMDNLMNGNIKEFRNLINALPRKKLKFYGSMTCDTRLTMLDYKMAYEAGLRLTNIGLESGSERVRTEMRKNPFSNKDFLNALQCMNDAGEEKIKLIINIIVGWPTETEEDFQESIDILKIVAKDHMDVVKRVSVNILGVNDTFLSYNMFDLSFDENHQWYYKDSNFKSRMERWYTLRHICDEVGLPLPTRKERSFLETMSHYFDFYPKGYDVKKGEWF